MMTKHENHELLNNLETGDNNNKNPNKQKLEF